VLGWAGGLGLLTLVLCVSISPLSDWTQEIGSCRNADTIERDVQDSSALAPVPGSKNGMREVGATTFTLACSYGEDIRYVENDTAVLRGFAVAFGLGAVPGALIGLFYAVRSLRRDERPPALPAAG
jgi:hypothetical protein